MRDNLRCSGAFIIRAVDAQTGKLIEERKIKNQLMATVQAQRDAELMGTEAAQVVPDWQIKYFALGTGTTAVTTADTQLANETYRQQITSRTNLAVGTVQTVIQMGTTIGNGTYTELGVFCGSTASSTANTGKLLSRIVFTTPLVKNSSIILTILRQDYTTI